MALNIGSMRVVKTMKHLGVLKKRIRGLVVSCIQVCGLQARCVSDDFA